MGRTRSAVLEGTVRAVEKHGSRRATMADIAALSGVAKATLYNHFRARGDVYTAVVQSGVAELAAECAGLARHDLAEALAMCAERIGSHPALRRIASDEPAVLASFVCSGDGPTWELARAGAREVLAAAGRSAEPAYVALLVRWLASHVATPATAAEARAGARVLTAGLPPAQVVG
jgi:AcrR family transcriptional regulator